MMQWWQSLSARDRRVLVIGAAAVAVILYVFGLRIPSHNAVAELETQVREERELVNWMEQARREIYALRGQGDPDADAATTRSLFSLADESARQAGLGPVLQRVEPTGDNGARVNFENIAFDELISWLARMRSEHGVVADQLTVRRGADDGRVDVQLVLEPA